MKKKIIFLYASAGSGHFSSAKALYEYFEERDNFFDIYLIDALDYTNFFFENIYRLGYKILVGHLRYLWAVGFRITEERSLSWIINLLRFTINRLNSKKLKNFLLKENPDFVISTHFLPIEVCGYLKKRGLINPILIAVITDLGVHPFWVNPYVDLYITAMKDTAEELSKYNIDKEKIGVFGIPVSSKFYKIYDIKELEKNLGVSSKEFNVLLVMGSLGLGYLEKIVEILYREVNLLIVCGNNCRLYHLLVKRNYKNVKVFGFVQNIQELMYISALIITKPGGITVFEILASKIPAVFVFPIPGQEEKNFKMLKNYGIFDFADDLAELKRIVLDYKNNPAKLYQRKKTLENLEFPNACKELYDAICQSCFGTSYRQ